MARPLKGVYVAGYQVVRFGYQDREPRGAEEFHAVTEATARVLLRETELADLAWNGTVVVRRDQTEIDARLRTETITADDAYFDRERGKAAVATRAFHLRTA